MAYNDFTVIAGGLAHVPVLIGVAKLIETRTANSDYVKQQAALELAEAEAKAKAEAEAKAKAEAEAKAKAQAEAKAKAKAEAKAKTQDPPLNQADSNEG